MAKRISRKCLRIQAAQLLEQISNIAQSALEQIRRIQEEGSRQIEEAKKKLEKIQEQCPHKTFLPAQGPVQLFVTCADCGKVLEN